MWVFFSFVAIASQKFYRRVAKHHCCFISHGATPGADDVTGQGDLAGWPYLYYRALSCGNIGHIFFFFLVAFSYVNGLARKAALNTPRKSGHPSPN